MTPEARVKQAIDRVLNDGHAYYHKAIGTSFGKPCLDYDISKLGFYAACEAKRSPKKHPTPRQTTIMQEVISVGGGSVFLIDDINGVDIWELANWLGCPRAGYVSSSASAWLTRKDHEQVND